MKLLVLLAVGYLIIFSAMPTFSAETRQGELAGTVKDASTREALPAVSVVVKGTVLGAMTDLNGRFCIPKIPAGTYSVEAVMIGYKTAVIEGIGIVAGKITTAAFKIEQTAIELSPIIVTASKKAQLLQESPVSITVVSSADLQQRNEATLDRALQRSCPGLEFKGGEVGIRGSTGYSQGAGSRVLLLIDDSPAIAGDTGTIKWDIIPITEVQRVEVIKGAGSALYGSNALSGVINIITKEPTQRPETRASLSWGFYSKPYYSQWEWTDQRLDFQSIDLSHSRKLGNSSVLISAGRKYSDGYSQNGGYERWNLFGKLTSTFSPQTRFTLLTAWATDHWGYSAEWKGRDRALEVPDECRNDKVLSDKFNIHCSLKQVVNSQLAYILKTYCLKTYWKNQFHDNGDYANSYRAGGELRAELLATERHSLTVGLEGVYNEVESTMFGDHNTHDPAVYIQDEVELLPILKATLGMRYDTHWVDGNAIEDQLSPRGGIVYRPSESTSLRASVGRGFRAPSVAETFTRTIVSGFLIVPNPDIRAERTWSYEIGMNQLLGNRLVLDMALFQSDYKQMIEPKSVGSGEFQLANVTQACIRGVEIGLKGQLWRKFLSGNLSYTYIDPRDLTLDQTLPYRHRHQVLAAAFFNYRALRVGGDFHYRSRPQKAIDFLAADERVTHYVLNINSSIKLSDRLTFSGQIDNLLQYHYAEVPRHLAPIRNYSLTLTAKL